MLLKDRSRRHNVRSHNVEGFPSMPSTTREFLEPGTRIRKEPTPNDLSVVRKHRLYRIAWNGANVLLVGSICLANYTMVWEYSTRRYLRGFSDAVVPAFVAPEERIAAILNWMAHGPARLPESPAGITQDRDPIDTLNYTALLKVCGSATNAFINIADSSGLYARRLLLLDANRGAKHVVAEVLVNGRWIVVDPSFRTILRSASGQLLTRTDLADPAVFSLATHNIPKYDPSYDYASTAHVRLVRVPFFGVPMRSVLDRYLPGWDDAPAISLFLERESLAAAVTSLMILLFIVLFRVGLRWYGESHLGIRTISVRTQFRCAAHAFLSKEPSRR